MMQPHAGAPVGCSKCLGHCSYRDAVLLPVWRGQYHAHPPLSPCLCYLCSPHRWHCGLTAEGRLACGKVEGFAIRRSVSSRELQAPWSGPDHACAPGCAARRPADLQAGRFQRQAGPPPPRDLRDPVKHPGRVQARLEGMRGQLLPSPLLPHHCALSPPPALARAPWCWVVEIPVSSWRSDRVWPEMAICGVASL